jgi:excisionase family DNA binding protein
MESQGLLIKDDEVIMTAEDVATFFKVSVSAVRRWTRNGQLKGHKLGGKGDWRYLKGDVVEFLLWPPTKNL